MEANILLARENDFSSVKIADFGLSFQFSKESAHDKMISKRCGTFTFMAPEQLTKKQYSKVRLNIKISPSL
jgi:calcium-dependent protein kinase